MRTNALTNFFKNSVLRSSNLFLSLVAIWIMSSSDVFAWDITNIPNPPPVAINSALGFHSLYQENDAVFIARIELDQDATPNDWCDALRDTTGCASVPVSPINITSLSPDSSGNIPISLNLEQNITGGYQIIKQNTNITRIHHSLVAIYIQPNYANSISWGNPNTRMCLQPSATIWAGASANCRFVNWMGSASSSFQNEVINELKLLNDSLDFSNYYLVTSNNEVSENGYTYIEEMIPNLSRIPITCDMFQISRCGNILGVSGTPIPTNPQNYAIQQRIDTEYANTGLKTDIDNVALNFIGVSGSMFWLMIEFLLGGLASFMIYKRTQNPVMSSVGFVAPFTIGIYTGTPSVATLVVMISVASIFTTGYVMRRLL